VSPSSAREWIIGLTAVSLAFSLLIFIYSPVAFPLDNKQSLDLVQITTPSLVGYLVSAAQFVFIRRPEGEVAITSENILRFFVFYPFAVFWFLLLALLVYFKLSQSFFNNGSTPLGFAEFKNLYTIILSLLTAVINILVLRLFEAERHQAAQPNKAVRPGE